MGYFNLFQNIFVCLIDIKIMICLKWNLSALIKTISNCQTGPDPDIGPLGGHQFWQGVKGPSRTVWVQGKALVGGPGGETPRSKTIFSILNGFGELSVIMFLAYFFIFRV